MQTLVTPSVTPGRAVSGRSAADFLWQADRALALLRGQHALRLSFFRIELGPRATESVVAALDAALHDHALVGRLPDGAVGVLYLGVRATSAGADQALERQVAERVRRELARLPGAGAVREVCAVHHWADEIAGTFELIDAVSPAAAMRKAS